MTCTKVSDVSENPAPLPDFTRWPSFPFEGDLRVKKIAAPVEVEPPRSGEDAADCVACNTPDDAYIWVSERWRVRAMDRPTGLPMVLILECRSHLDLGDLPNLLAAELGVMTVRLERAIRSLDGVARVHVNRWGDGSAHLHMWFLARPYGQLQLRGTFLSLWDDILPRIPEQRWRENLAHVAAWLAEFGGRALAEPPHIQWQSPSTFSVPATAGGSGTGADAHGGADVSSSESEAHGGGLGTAPGRDAGANDSGSGADMTTTSGRAAAAGGGISGPEGDDAGDPAGHGADPVWASTPGADPVPASPPGADASWMGSPGEAAKGGANVSETRGPGEGTEGSADVSGTRGRGEGTGAGADVSGTKSPGEAAGAGADVSETKGSGEATDGGVDPDPHRQAGPGPDTAAEGGSGLSRGAGAIPMPREIDHDSPAPAYTANDETGR